MQLSELENEPHLNGSTGSASSNNDRSRCTIPRRTSHDSKKAPRSHTFSPRISHLDRYNAASSMNAFRGFYTLFWIMLGVGGIRTVIRSYEDDGILLGLEFGRFIGEDALNLAMSDAILVGVTILCVPFIKLITGGWLRYHGAGIVLQHIIQTAYLLSAVRWTFHRQWQWVQSGFMTLHALSMLMKVHSYCATNGELSEKALKLKRCRVELELLISASGSRAGVESEAYLAWETAVALGSAEKLEESSDTIPDGLSEYEPHLATATPPVAPSSNSTGTLRRRLSTSRPRPDNSPIPSIKADGVAEDLMSAIDVLTWSSDEKISTLAGEMSILRDALVSKGEEKVMFPSNVTYFNYLDYLLVPSLVYELEFPRLKKIRPMYIVEKSLATFGTFSVVLLITEKFILPISPSTHEHHFLISALDLAVPFMINYLLIFYIIFECILNVFAEITRFADREFYQDWWNSTSFDEFSRRWNVPVHAFLLRHVYTSTMTTYRFSKFQAAFTTFLLSALVHELVMAVVTKKIRLYLFLSQMLQLPMIMVGRHKFFKQYPGLGNLVFWLGLMSGFPLLAVSYLRH